MRYLIVDGHSVVFAWPDLRLRHARRSEGARDELVKQLTAYQDASGVRVVAVFDGKGAQGGETSEAGGIQVFYSAAGQSADEVIERLVAKYSHRHEITVATDDNLERQTALSFGAVVVSTEHLRDLLSEAQSDLAHRLKRHRQKG